MMALELMRSESITLASVRAPHMIKSFPPFLFYFLSSCGPGCFSKIKNRQKQFRHNMPEPDQKCKAMVIKKEKEVS